MTKSSSWPGAVHVNGAARGSPHRHTDDDLAIEIADENDWAINHALDVVRDILSRASAAPRSTRSYVRTAIRTEPDRYQPAPVRNFGIPRHPFEDDPDNPEDPGRADCASPERTPSGRQ